MAAQESMVSGMAGRYAKALFELALEQKGVDALRADLDRFEALLVESPELERMVRSPVFTAEEQGRALTMVLEKAGIDGLAAKFLMVLTQNRRLFAVRDVIRSFRALVAQHKGEVTAQITVAEKPSDHYIETLTTTLKGVTGKDVDLAININSSIIGGLIVKLGSRMVGSSLKTKLNAIKHAMKETG